MLITGGLWRFVQKSSSFSLTAAMILIIVNVDVQSLPPASCTSRPHRKSRFRGFVSETLQSRNPIEISECEDVGRT